MKIGSPKYKLQKEYEQTEEYRNRFTKDEPVEVIQPVSSIDTELSSSLNKFSDFSELRDFNEVTGDYIADTLWNKVFYTNSMDGPAVTTTSSSELFSIATRQADTSRGRYLAPLRESRFRCAFYFESAVGAADCTAYIGSMGSSTLDSGITSINQSEMEYIAFKITNGVVTLNSKNLDGKKVQKSISLATPNWSQQHSLEILYFARERADFYFDNQYVGSISEVLPSGVDSLTYFPLMVSLTRSGGTNRTVTVESWEFLQTRN